MNKCINCNKEISDKARYCSDKCRMAYKRTQPEQPEQITPNNQPEQAKKQPEQNNPNNYKIMDTKGFHGEKMYYCSNHQEHCKRYCDAMCDDTCKHIDKREDKPEHKRCSKCGERIIDIKEQWVNQPNEEAGLIDVCIRCVKNNTTEGIKTA